MDLPSYLIVCFIFCFAYWWIKNQKKRPLLPKGPPGIPFLGNLHQIAVKAPLQYSEWVEKYGKLYTIHIGRSPALVVSDPQLLRQLFGTISSTGRFASELWDQLFCGPYGITGTEGLEWQEQRLFFVRTLRQFGFGKASQMEPMILTEVENLQKELDSKMEKHGKVLKTATGNLLMALITGEIRPTKVAKLLTDWQKTIQVASGSGIEFLPWLKYLAPKWSGYEDYMKSVHNVHAFIKKYFDEHLECQKEEIHNDVICAYLEHWGKTRDDDKSSFGGEKGYQHCFQSVLSVLLAGSETTATGINWMIYYMCVHSEVQRKVQKEIDEIIGNERDPSLNDLKRMPYAEAVLQETLRMSCIAPMGFIHRLLEDASFGEYKLPKDLLLIPNIYHIQKDPEIWGDPETFRPERFLEGDETHRKTLKDAVVSFMPGKRVCPGEQMAREIMFLFLTKLFKSNNFQMKQPDNSAEYMEPTIGFFMSPKDLSVTMSARSKI